MGWWKERKARRAASRASDRLGQSDPDQRSASSSPSETRVIPQGPAVTETWPADGGPPDWIYDGMAATLFGGNEDLEVVGESYYQDALWATVHAALGKTSDRVRVDAIAVLVPERDNKYDDQAVSVWINRMKVGHLSREDAAALRPGILAAVRETGGAVALPAVIVGGGPREDSRIGMLGVWMNYDPAELGVETAPAAVPPSTGSLRTGLSAALVADEADDDYDLAWLESLPEDPAKRLPAIRALLEKETEPLSRHFILSELEAELYAFRDTFPTALEEYDAAAEQHDREIHTIRPVLIAKLGSLPRLETYRQSSIRHAKAKNIEQALWWAQRGIEVYGDQAHKDEWVADLHKRVATLQSRIERANRPRTRPSATPSIAEGGETEDLVCQTCGHTFTRVRTRGRKPLNCPDCR